MRYCAIADLHSVGLRRIHGSSALFYRQGEYFGNVPRDGFSYGLGQCPPNVEPQVVVQVRLDNACLYVDAGVLAKGSRPYTDAGCDAAGAYLVFNHSSFSYRQGDGAAEVPSLDPLICCYYCGCRSRRLHRSSVAAP